MRVMVLTQCHAMPPRCVSTGDEIGMLQIVPNSATLAGIVNESANQTKRGGQTVMAKGLRAKVRAAMNVYSNTAVMKEWLDAQVRGTV